MPSYQIQIAVTLSRDLITDLPAIIAENEEQLQKIAFELGELLQGDVYRLANGVCIVKTLAQ